MPEELLVGLCIIPLFAIPFIFFAFLRYLRYRETIALAEKGLLLPGSQHNGRDTLRWGIVILALGLALTCGLYPIGWAIGQSFLLYFGPWMLVGLLPTALGLALIIIYRVTRDQPDNGQASGAGSGGAPPTPGRWQAPGPGSGTESETGPRTESDAGSVADSALE